MRVSVTKAHVETAVRRDSHRCMIADAIRETTKANFVLVDLQSIRFSNLKTGKRYFYLTPPTAQRAIIAFDRGKAVQPFTFRLVNPVKVRNVQRVRTGDPAVVKRARAKYEATTRARGSMRHIARRERRYGVRVLAS